MKARLLLALMLTTLLAACQKQGPAPTVSPPLPSATSAPRQPSATWTPRSTASPLPTASATPTPKASCQQTLGLLQRPVPPGSNPFPDGGYPYGSTENGAREPHHGVEFINPAGTPVLAAADGIVYFAGDDSAEARFSPWTHFYGNLVVLQHQICGQTVYTLYAHLSQIDVEDGQTVRAGQQIGAVGMTGAAIGAHLHFEVRLGGETYTDTRNPVLWLQPADPARRGALRGRVQSQNGIPVHATLTVQYLSPEHVILRQYFIETYAPEQYPVPTIQENFALGDLPGGIYRIALIAHNRLLERYVTVTDDHITDTTLTLP